MKIFILTDLEGTAGVTQWSHVGVGSEGPAEEYRQAKLWMTGEINSAVEGILEKDAKADIVVWDGHGSGGITLEHLHPGAKLIPRGFFHCPYGLNEGFDAMLMIAQHSKAGTPKGNLSHTYSLNVYRYWLNGKEIGEIGLRSYLAGYFNIPVILVTGDEAACEEARSLIPGVEVAAVKKAIHQELAVTLHPQKACDLIRDATRRAVVKLTQIKPIKIPGPYVLRAQFLTTRVVEEITFLRREARKIDALTVEMQGDDLLDVICPLA